MSGTPVLVVKGSGKAADLIADIHLANTEVFEGDVKQLNRITTVLNALDAKKGNKGRDLQMLEQCPAIFEKIFDFYGMKLDKNKDTLLGLMRLIKSTPQGYAAPNIRLFIMLHAVIWFATKS